jgi:hypothetical protein
MEQPYPFAFVRVSEYNTRVAQHSLTLQTKHQVRSSTNCENKDRVELD